MTLTFTQKEFEKFRTFQLRLAKEFGETVYVGTNNAVVLVEYSPQLTAMLRPFPPENHFDYELSQLTCEVCKGKVMFISLPGETTYVCNDCVSKRKSKG
jgi:hypothetical protein